MLVINKEVKTVKQMLKEYIEKNVECLKGFVSDEELDNGMIILHYLYRDGKSFDIRYNTENGFLRKTYDGWNESYEYNVYFN